jgi:hypothetical protein
MPLARERTSQTRSVCARHYSQITSKPVRALAFRPSGVPNVSVRSSSSIPYTLQLAEAACEPSKSCAIALDVP